jgi:hypothetical protein
VHLSELLNLEPLVGARLDGISPDAHVHAVDVMPGGDVVVMMDSSGVAVAEIVAAGSLVSAPALILAPAVPLIEAFAALTRELAQQSDALARRSGAVLRSLAQADLDGSDLQSIVTLLASLVGNPVTMKDSMFRLMAWSGDPAVLDSARRSLVADGRVPDDVVAILEEEGIFNRLRTETAPFRIERDHDVLHLSPRVVCPVRCGGVQFGFLSISEGSRELDEFDFAAIEYGATVVAFHLFRERAVAESLHSQRALLVYDLLFNQSTPSSTSRRQAAMLQIDLSESFIVMTFAIQ